MKSKIIIDDFDDVIKAVAMVIAVEQLCFHHDS